MAATSSLGGGAVILFSFLSFRLILCLHPCGPLLFAGLVGLTLTASFRQDGVFIHKSKVLIPNLRSKKTFEDYLTDIFRLIVGPTESQFA